MTDTTAGRGGVGIRLFVQGGEVVRRTFDQVGDSGRKMWSEIALGERSANPAIRALSVGANEAKAGLQGLASRAGSVGAALGVFGVAGLAAAAALGALAIAVTSAFAAMGNAAELTDTADRIGLGVEALQEWRYVADEAGVDTAKLEAGMEKLNGVLGKFKMGIGDGKLKPVFEELGITKADLDNVTSADQLLTLLADTLGQVGDRAKQVSMARALGIEELLPILRMGSEEIKQFKDEASELGFVMGSETVAELDKADRAMERAGEQFRVIKDTTLAPLATMFSELTAEIASSSVEISQMTGQLPAWQRAMAQFAQWVPGLGGVVRNLAKHTKGALTPNQDAFVPFNMRDLDIEGVLAAPRSGFELNGHTRSGGSSGASAAAAAARTREREEEQRRQRQERADQQIERADEAIAKSYDKGFLSIDGRATYEVADLERERAARLREIARAEEEYIRSKGLRGLTEAEGEQLRLKQTELTEQKAAVVEWERRRDIAARHLKDDEDTARASIELLDIDAQMVRTNRERVRIEREILLATIEIARKRKQAELDNDPELTDEERRGRMGTFERSAGRQVDLFDDRESERLRSQFKGYGREVVDAIRDGRIGEYIGDKIKERLIDGALDQLFNLFKGAKSDSGGGSSWLQTAFDVAFGAFGGSGGNGKAAARAAKAGGARAAGGSMEAGRFYTTVEHGRPELMMIGGNGHVTSAAETVRMLQDSLSQQGGASASGDVLTIEVPVNIDARGADADGLARVEDQLRKLRADLPSIAVKSVAEAKQRRLTS